VLGLPRPRKGIKNEYPWACIRYSKNRENF
jgi:hypothetical protein